MEGAAVGRFFADPDTGRYGYHEDLTHTLMKVETHNHPTAISPFPGAATGSGGEIRDEGATGRGSKPKAGLCGFSVSNLRIPGFERPWEGPESRPGAHRVAARDHDRGPDRRGVVQQRVRPAEPRRLLPDATSRRPAASRAATTSPSCWPAASATSARSTRTRRTCPPARCSSRSAARACSSAWAAARPRRWPPARTRPTSTSTRCSAATPRSSAAPRRSSTAAGRSATRNPILSIHDVGAGGLSNALPETRPRRRAAARASTCARRPTKSRA